MPDTTFDHTAAAPASRAAVNHANAQRSTGPRTEAGKRRSSLNALRHGLTGQTIVLPSEDLDAYQRLTRRFSDEFEPKGAVEEQLVQSLADAAWRLNRVAALETNLLSLSTVQPVLISTDHPEAQDALAAAQNLHANTRALNTLSMHSQRLSRQFQQTLKLLREIQAERRYTQEWEERSAAIRVAQHQRAQAARSVASFSNLHTSAPALPRDPLPDQAVWFDSHFDEPLALATLRPPQRIQEIRTR